MPNSNLKVFAVIVTFNGEKWINQCIDSLQNSKYPINIVVIDNHSTDKTIDILKKYSNIHLVLEKKNHGFGIANNIGISVALENAADYTFLLNQDAFINEETIQNLLNTAEKYNSFGLYSPIHLNESGKNFDKNFLKNYIVSSAPQYLSDLCIKGKADPIYPIYSVNAAAWFIRNEVFEIAGGFDPIFFMYGEDNDFCNRLEFHGIKRAIATNSFIHHSRGKISNESVNFFTGIKLRANRIQANALAKIKNPNKKLSTSALSSFVNLLFAATNELIYCLSLKGFLSHILAIIFLLIAAGKITQHRNICMNSKKPWLETKS